MLYILSYTYAFSALTLLVRRHERHLLCKKFCHKQCSWLTMTAWWQHAVSKSGTLSLSQEGCSPEVGGQDSSQKNITYSQRGGNLLSPCQEHCHPSVLWRCCLGDSKDIRPPVTVTVFPTWGQHAATMLSWWARDTDIRQVQNLRGAFPALPFHHFPSSLSHDFFSFVCIFLLQSGSPKTSCEVW